MSLQTDRTPAISRVGPVTVPVPAYGLVVPALAGVGGAAFLAWRPGVARSMLGSPQAVGFTLVIGLLVLGAGWLLPRLGRQPATTVIVQAVPVLVAFVLTVLPAFRQVTVEEASPSAAVVAGAQLHGIDHRAAGDVLLLSRADGSYVVRLRDIDIEPGPDYQVHLVPGANRGHPDGGRHLDKLRGNRGSQNYDLPEDFRPERPVTLLVWCRAFAVPIAAATLR
ncbi:MAG: DM13 domain-containing protein [Actinomycetes bacterium]